MALGIASFVALVGAYRDLGTSYDRTYERLRFADMTFEVTSAPQTIATEIAAIPGVQSATGRLVLDGGLPIPSKSGRRSLIRCRLIGVPAPRHPAVDDVLVTSGSYLNGASPWETLVESHFAKAYSVKPGDLLSPYIDGKPTALSVIGVAASPEYLIVSASRQDIIPDPRHFAVLFVPLRSLQAAYGVGRTVNNLAVLFRSGASGFALAAKIRSLLAPYGLRRVTLRKDQPSNAALKVDLEGFREIGFLMPALILLAAAASLFVMLGSSESPWWNRVSTRTAFSSGSERAFLLHCWQA